eukprot:IDg20327t1
MNVSEVEDYLESSYKRRCVDEELSMGKRKRKCVAKEQLFEDLELQFIFIELVEITKKEVAPPIPDDVRRPTHGKMSETRRVRKCYNWILGSRKTDTYDLHVFEPFIVVRRGISMLESEEGKARLADINRPSLTCLRKGRK